ncbi:MAG: ABC transporter ATP-binding protein [Nitrospinaceae bacterium]|nr:ABC transporter ATP-binding protein [Nitrospinaceae bacterium]MBT3432604.1 ABC transporter ATP-binding protein [Nitrospinaceae bacterium]MBT4095364.1 ABC transporter ATP-binding protein [Nitrospinaceae bacterium]MBT4432439.1 ABC transporter ATP-binding protein [Nitrospinaceae bacterium]MBT5369103.1 ABC transporter ATP-binding protein [Nitrospinaceae bacterium]
MAQLATPGGGAPNAEEVVIEVRNLDTYYGTRKILKDVSFDVHKGEIFVILGGSGSGKSTLLRHIVGLLKPSAGSIKILGHETATMGEEEWQPIRRKMGVLFQGGALFNSLTVGENIALPLREYTDLPEATIGIQVRMKLGLVDLAGFENLKPDQLSGGMKKRAGLARAISMDPEVLFFDEPSAGLDPIAGAGLDELILRLRDTFGMTIVVVTHEMESIKKIADRVIMLFQGETAAVGPLDEVMQVDHPKIRQFFERHADEEKVDPHEYLDYLTASGGTEH